MAWLGQFSKPCTGKPLALALYIHGLMGPVEQAVHRKPVALALHIHGLMGPVQQAIHSVAFSTGREHLLPWWGQFSKQCTGKPLALAVSFGCCSGASSASNAQCTFSMAPLQISSKTLCLLRHDSHSLSLFDNSYSVSSSWVMLLSGMFSHRGISLLLVPSSWNVSFACFIIIECLYCLFSHHRMSLLLV